MKIIKLFYIILVGFIFIVFLNLRNIKAQTCTQLSSLNSATLKGQITNTGGDSDIKTWFNWRPQDSSSWNETPIKNFIVNSVPFEFSYKLSGLSPCTTYEYKAVVQNSAGINEGNIVCFKTSCVIPITVSCSASPNPAQVNQTVIFTANIQGGEPPYTYIWSNACSGSYSSCTKSFSSKGIYNATIIVKDKFNNSANASCSVEVRASLPYVITLPPVETL